MIVTIIHQADRGLPHESPEEMADKLKELMLARCPTVVSEVFLSCMGIQYP